MCAPHVPTWQAVNLSSRRPGCDYQPPIDTWRLRRSVADHVCAFISSHIPLHQTQLHLLPPRKSPATTLPPSSSSALLVASDPSHHNLFFFVATFRPSTIYSLLLLTFFYSQLRSTPDAVYLVSKCLSTSLHLGFSPSMTDSSFASAFGCEYIKINANKIRMKFLFQFPEFGPI